MNGRASFLVLLVFWALVDDFWAAAPVLPSAPLAEDDEYLPAQRRPQEDECPPHHKPVFVGLQPRAADFPLARKDKR